MLDIMALPFILGALSAFPFAHAHMQMINPSPLRDPHADRDRVYLTGLSMGMSGDYEIAVEEGATVVRVGSALFGKR